MSDVIGRGVIEVSADATKLKAGIDDAKRSISGMGDAAEKAAARTSRSIDKYIKDLQTQNATVGMSAREADKYKLALRGASAEQLAAADAAHRLAEAHEKGAIIGQRISLAIAALAAGSIAAYVAFDRLVKKAGDFQDLAEKTGDSAQNVASLAVAAGTAGIEMKDVAGLAVKLSKNLVGVDDDSKAAGAAVKALGLNMAALKEMGAADRLEAIGKALNGFSDSAAKGDVAVALLSKSGADALPFLKELGQEGGRQVILTNEQIALADDYADKQARLRSEISLYAQAIATTMLPSVVDLTGAFKDMIAEIAGMGKGATELQKNTAIADFADTAVQALAFVVDAGDGVARVFELIGKSIGGLLAASERLAVGDLESVRMIAKESDAEYQRILNRQTLGQKLDERIAARKAAAKEAASPDNNYIETADSVRNPRLKFDSGTKEKTDAANKIAAARLNLDLANIKKAGDAQVEAYTNAERIMQAVRSAGLIDDQDYYAAKLGFLRLNSAAQEAELKKEIDRLQQETLVGKHKIDNDKKIVEAQGKLAKLRADGLTAIEINSIQEEAENRRVAQSYVDATKSAEQYINTIRKQAARDLAGVGMGDKFRQDQNARGQMADGQDSKIEGLNTDLRNNKITQDQYDKYLEIVTSTYAQEVEAYTARTAAMDSAQGDWLNGANEAMANYQAKAQDVAGQSAAAFTSAYEGLTDGVSTSIAHSIRSGESLQDSLANVALNIAESFIAAFIKIGIQKLLVDKTTASLYATTIAAQAQAMVAMAGLNAFASTAAIPLVGPIAAPGAAAAATAIAEGFATAATTAAALSVASAAGGFDIPRGVNPLTQLHEEEMVLPAQHANTIRRLGEASNQGGDRGAPVITYAPVIQIDSRSDQAQVRQMVAGAIAQGNADLVDKLQRAGRI